MEELSDIREGENNVAVAPDSTYTARLSQHLRIGMTSAADLLDSPLCQNLPRRNRLLECHLQPSVKRQTLIRWLIQRLPPRRRLPYPE